MSQGEFARLPTWASTPATSRSDAGARACDGRGNSQAARAAAGRADARATRPTPPSARTGLDDELEMIRDQFRRFADEQVVPHAHDWHLNDELIPMEIIAELAELGVFGLTIPEEYRRPRPVQGRRCVVVSRGAVARLYRRRLARHPVGDRGRADPVRRHRRAEGALAARASPAARSCRRPSSPSPTPAPTSARCARARCGTATAGAITGNKTWITHAARAHVMTLLARTDPDTTD